MVTIGLYNLLTYSTVGLNREIKSFPIEAQCETISKVGHAIAEIHLVIIVDLTVVVDIVILHVAWLDICLEYTITV